MRTPGAMIMCGYLNNVENGYDVNFIKINDGGEHYKMYILAIDN